jgi:hypothetical protein
MKNLGHIFFLLLIASAADKIFVSPAAGYDNYQVRSWGDDIVTWGPGTDPALDSPQAIANMMAHWKGRGFSSVCWRPDPTGLPGWDQIEMRNDPNLLGAILMWQIDPVLQANATFNVLESAEASATANGMTFWAWVPTVYSRGAPAAGPGITAPYPEQNLYVYQHPEVLTIDRKGTKQYMVSEYAYDGARSSKVDEFEYYAQQCGVRNFIACLRTESFQIQAEPNKGDQFGFNQPVVDAMQSLYDVNILTDPRFDVYSSSFNLNDPMVQNWRVLRGSYLTQFYRDLRAGLNSIDPNCKIAVWIPGGDYIGPTLGNWQLDWRTLINEGLIDQLGLWFNLAFQTNYTTRGYLTHYPDIGILSSSTFRSYIQSSSHPNVQLINSRGVEFYPTDPGSDFNGLLTFSMWDEYFIAWYQRWQQWKQDLKDFGYIKFIYQNFDNFPVGTNGNGGGWGNYCYIPSLRSSPGFWTPIGNGSDTQPTIQNTVRHGTSGCALKLTYSTSSPVEYCSRKAGYDASNPYSWIENNISNGTATVQFWAYRRYTSSAVMVLFADGQAASDSSVGLDLRASGVIAYLSNDQWVVSNVTSPTNTWQMFTFNVDVDNMRYSAYMGSNAETPICVNAPYTKSPNGFSEMAFLPEASISFIDDVSVNWVPHSYFAIKQRNTFLADDFEGHAVGSTLNGTSPETGAAWTVVPSNMQSVFLTENRNSFANGYKCMSVQGWSGAVISAGNNAPLVLDPNYLVTADFDVYLRSTTQAKVALLKSHGGNPTTAVYAHDGYWYYWQNGAYQKSNVAYNNEMWIHIQMVLNCSTHTYNGFVQNVGEMPKPLASGVAWDSGTSATDSLIMEINAPAGSSNLTYFDNFLVTYGAPGCGDELHPYPQGDLSQDCQVNMLDLEIFAQNWLGSGPTADFNQDGNVNLMDFANFAADWTLANQD